MAISDLSVPSSVSSFFTATSSVQLRAYDYEGTEYIADIGLNLASSSTFTEEISGPVFAQLRTHKRQTPVSPTGNSLSFFFNCHAWYRFRADSSVVELYLNVHTACTDKTDTSNGHGTVPVLYFSHLDLLLSSTSWTSVSVIPEPLMQSPVNSSGKKLVRLAAQENAPRLTLFPQGAQKFYRLAIYPDNSANAAEALDIVNFRGWATASSGFNESSVKTWSWSNPSTACFGPLRALLPEKQTIAAAGTRWISYLSGMQQAYQSGSVVPAGNGAYTFGNQPRLGILHPRGLADGGSTGGGEVFQIAGSEVLAAEHSDALKVLDLFNKGTFERSINMGFKPNGDPISYEDYLTEILAVINSSAPAWNAFPNTSHRMFNSAQDAVFGFSHSAVNSQQNVPTNNKPTYDSSINNSVLGAYKTVSTHDWAHMSRFMWGLWPGVYFFNDPICKLKSIGVGEFARLGNPMLETGTAYQFGSDSLVTRYYQMLAIPAQKNVGGSLGRIEGWKIMSVATAAPLISDSAKRQNLKEWARDVALLFDHAQIRPGSGSYQSVYTDKIGGPPQSNYGTRAGQVIELGIGTSGLYALYKAIIHKDKNYSSVDATFRSLLSYTCVRLWRYWWAFENPISSNFVPNPGTATYPADVRPKTGPYFNLAVAPYYDWSQLVGTATTQAVADGRPIRFTEINQVPHPVNKTIIPKKTERINYGSSYNITSATSTGGKNYTVVVSGITSGNPFPSNLFKTYQNSNGLKFLGVATILNASSKNWDGTNVANYFLITGIDSSTGTLTGAWQNPGSSIIQSNLVSGDNATLVPGYLQRPIYDTSNSAYNEAAQQTPPLAAWPWPVSSWTDSGYAKTSDYVAPTIGAMPGNKVADGLDIASTDEFQLPLVLAQAMIDNIVTGADSQDVLSAIKAIAQFIPGATLYDKIVSQVDTPVYQLKQFTGLTALADKEKSLFQSL